MTLLATAQDLGRRVLRRWQEVGRPADAFADIAHTELAAVLPNLVAPPAAWIAELSAQDHLPPLLSATSRAFGEPPVRLWQRAGVAVDVYFWLGPFTGLHDHGFSGAFGVLAAPSVHSVFRFDSDQAVDLPLRVGRVVRCHTELLLPGDVRAIAGRDRLPHRVMHLGRPSLSICVRTLRDHGAPPQRSFLMPALSVVSEQHLPRGVQHRPHLGQHVVRARSPDAPRQLAALLAGTPDLLAFWILWRTFLATTDGATVMAALALVPQRPWFDALVLAMFAAVGDSVNWNEVTRQRDRLERAMASDDLPEDDRQRLRARLATLADRP